MKKVIIAFSLFFGSLYGMHDPSKEKPSYTRLFFLYQKGYVPWLAQNKKIHSPASLSSYLISRLEHELEQNENIIKASKDLLDKYKHSQEVDHKVLVVQHYIQAFASGNCFIEQSYKKINTILEHLQELCPEVEVQIRKSKL